MVQKLGEGLKGHLIAVEVNSWKKLEAFRPGYDPLIALIEIPTDQTVDLPTKIQCHKILASYIHPKPKPVDQITDVSEPISIEMVSPYLAQTGIEWRHQSQGYR